MDKWRKHNLCNALSLRILKWYKDIYLVLIDAFDANETQTVLTLAWEKFCINCTQNLHKEIPIWL